MLGVAALAGAAIGYWLNSDKGRSFRKETTTKIEDTAAQAKTYLQEGSEEIRKVADNLVEKGQHNLQHISQQARAAMQEVAKAGDKEISSTQERLTMELRQAQEKIDRLARQLEQPFS